jgi:hypothetical protein
LRASNYYRTSYPFLYGAPVDPRLVEAFDNETGAFLKAAALFDPPVEPVEIPYEGTPRPTNVQTNGYGSNIQESYYVPAPLPRQAMRFVLSKDFTCF